MICTWAVWYLGVRVWTDTLRVDKRFFGLTGSQWTAAVFGAIAAGALIWWAIQARRGRVGPRAGPPMPAAADAPTTAFTPPPDPSA